ncbi:hypothetical protein QP028_08265 [Corynebacterium suedekumii]|nr:hypothetical protein QP028_08265 [Corynebacterium suedekumii]
MRPFFTGNGDFCPRGCTTVSFMNIDDILAQATALLLWKRIGQVLLQIAQAFYTILYPSNSDAATPVEIPF